MGLKRKTQIRQLQRLKRRKKRLKLKREGLNPDDYYYGGYYVGLGKDK